MRRNTKNGGIEMAEDAFVQMLLEAAGGNVADERDVTLARAAGAWAHRNGWRPYLGAHQGFICGHSGLEFWVDDVPTRDALLVMVRIHPGKSWRSHARYPIAHLGHALDVLAAEGLIPPRFSTIGRRALEDFAEALDRSASKMWQMADQASPAEIEEYGEHYPWDLRIRSAVMNRAADQARAFPRGELAVTS
jgi:hypothetical protein